MQSISLRSFKDLLLYTSCGVRWRDKLTVFLSLIVGKGTLFFRRSLLKNESKILGNYLIADALVKTQAGTFYCRRASGDLSIILFSEKALREFFVTHVTGDFIDVGANIGLYTVMMAKKIAREGTVVAFEPDRDNFEILKMNASLNGLDNVILYNLGLWHEKGQLPLFVDPNNPRLKSSLTLRPAQKSHHRQIVQVDTLDHITKDIDIRPKLIKIDVEGVEPEVLRGAIQTLNRHKPDLIFECLEERELDTIEHLLMPVGYAITPTSQRGYYLASIAGSRIKLKKSLNSVNQLPHSLLTSN